MSPPASQPGENHVEPEAESQQTTRVTSRDRLVILGQWLGLGALVGVICGAASAAFLWLLERATTFRTQHEVIVYTLPVAEPRDRVDLPSASARPSRPATTSVIDTVSDEGPGKLPLRMAPMVLIGTVLTHLFGGSAGREGTGVQMGASLTDWAVSHRTKVGKHVRAGSCSRRSVAAGFGSVFGTLIAGAVFGLEFVVLGRIEYDALVPALVASVVG